MDAPQAGHRASACLLDAAPAPLAAGTSIVGGADDVQALLDDHLVKTQAMRASPYITALEQEACQWEALLMALQVSAAPCCCWRPARLATKLVASSATGLVCPTC
jgi:hypothetical protein